MTIRSAEVKDIKDIIEKIWVLFTRRLVPQFYGEISKLEKNEIKTLQYMLSDLMNDIVYSSLQELARLADKIKSHGDFITFWDIVQYELKHHREKESEEILDFLEASSKGFKSYYTGMGHNIERSFIPYQIESRKLIEQINKIKTP